MALYVALAAIRIVRPQLRRNATAAARLLVLLRAVVAHTARLAVARALRLRHAAPGVVLSLIGEVSGAVVARLVAVARADIVALLLAPAADVRQNDRVDVALRTPAVSGRWGVARVVALREALVAIVGPEYGGPCVATVGASHRP